jgi:hypothetical protein
VSGVLPNFLVVGAARSGTAGLVEGLRTHPAVFITEPKEPHFFALHGRSVDFRGPGDAATINRVAVTDTNSYLALYPQDGGFTSLGDGSVSSLYYHDIAIPAIRAMNPQMRIVIMLRDPVARAYSSYQYMRARGFEPEESFLDAVAAEESRRNADWQHIWHYLAMSRYAGSVSAFLSKFGREHVGIWYYDDLQSDYEKTVAEVLRFIGAPKAEGEAKGVPRVNISGTPRSNALHQVIWAATKNEVIRSSVKRLTSYRMREIVRRAALRPSGVDAKTRAQLEPEFSEDLKRLAEVIGDDRSQPSWLAAHRSLQPTAAEHVQSKEPPGRDEV